MPETVVIREGKEQRTFTDVKKIVTSGGIPWIPESDAADKYYGALLTEQWGEIDLAADGGTEWELGTCYPTKELVNNAGSESFSVNFTTEDGTQYTGFWWSSSNNLYTVNAAPAGGSSVMIYANGNWTAGKSKWTIKGGTDKSNPNLLLWLMKASAVPFDTENTMAMMMEVLAGIINQKSGNTTTATLENLIYRLKTV